MNHVVLATTLASEAAAFVTAPPGCPRCSFSVFVGVCPRCGYDPEIALYKRARRASRAARWGKSFRRITELLRAVRGARKPRRFRTARDWERFEAGEVVTTNHIGEKS